MEESVKNFETNMGIVVDTAVKQGLAKYMVNYERVLNQFQKFFDHEELQKIIDSKADLALVQNTRDIKANKTEV
jgi:galactose-1-phosphate uridylyltransferase